MIIIKQIKVEIMSIQVFSGNNDLLAFTQAQEITQTRQSNIISLNNYNSSP